MLTNTSLRALWAAEAFAEQRCSLDFLLGEFSITPSRLREDGWFFEQANLAAERLLRVCDSPHFKEYADQVKNLANLACVYGKVEIDDEFFPPAGYGAGMWQFDRTAWEVARESYAEITQGKFAAEAGPILADALLDAGCPEGDPIQAHLRRPRQRLRGDWAFDLILGKD